MPTKDSSLRGWVKRSLGRIPSRQIERVLAYGLFEQHQRGSLATHLYETRHALWADLFTRASESPVCCLEFGVYRGRSLSYFATCNKYAESRFFGFDSFEGLPESWTAEAGKGAFSTGGATPVITDARVTLVRGWFNDSLPQFISSQPDLIESVRGGDRKMIVHFDADLFSSTLFPLMQIAPLVPEFLFIFDEFIGDESRALHYAASACGLEVEYYGHTRQSQGFPLVVSGRIMNPSVRAARPI